jgi:hypothetical protein
MRPGRLGAGHADVPDDRHSRSDRLWEQVGDAFAAHWRRTTGFCAMRSRGTGGQEIKEAGDSFLVAFASAGAAIACAVSCQQALAQQEWPEAVGPLLVRMARHTGDIQFRTASTTGLALHRASRMLTPPTAGRSSSPTPTAGLLRRDLEGGDVRLIDWACTACAIFRHRAPVPRRVPRHGAGAVPAARRPRRGHAANLPPQFTRFFGREREIAELTELLQSPETRLVTLTGPGGTARRACPCRWPSG